MTSLIKREFSAYFLSPVAYAMLFVFLLTTGILFRDTLNLMTRPGTAGAEYPFQSLFGSLLFWVFYVLIPPVLTMRLFAEERSTGTIETLMTAPIRDWQIVVGKFVACFAFYLVMLLPTLLYLPILLNIDWTTNRCGIDPWPAVTTYVGLILAGAMFIAIGMLFSSLVKNQIVAALITFFACIGFIAPAFFAPDPNSLVLVGAAFKYVSVPGHFHDDFTRGILDTRHLVLYLTMAAVCVFLTIRSIEVRRLG
jgi:ABC-2 type transport system permease protein